MTTEPLLLLYSMSLQAPPALLLKSSYCYCYRQSTAIAAMPLIFPGPSAPATAALLPAAGPGVALGQAQPCPAAHVGQPVLDPAQQGQERAAQVEV